MAVHSLHTHAPGARTHWAHVAVVALHTLCCGLPLAVSALGLAASAALAAGVVRMHDFLHSRELWLLGLSAALVAAGAFVEWRRMRVGGARRVSMLFAASLACLALNAAIVFGHRAATPDHAVVASSHAH